MRQSIVIPKMPRRNLVTHQPPPAPATSTLGEKGLNLRELPQLLSSALAQKMDNFLIDAAGQLVKSKGKKLMVEKTGITGFSMLEHWFGNVFVAAYGKTVAAIDLVAGTISELKTNFTTSDPFSGVNYLDYFFTCNGGDKIYLIKRTLNYDNQSANYTVNLTLTGATSGATAVILENTDGGSTGTLVLGNISGAFADDETITDTSTGSALVNGTLGYSITAISNAPKAKVLYTFVPSAGSSIGARLFAGNIQPGSGSSITPDISKTCWSKVDDGTNPPFSTWSTGTGAADPNAYFNRSGGALNALASLGNQLIQFYDKKRTGIGIDTTDLSGVQTQETKTYFDNPENGGVRGAKTTSKGILFANSSGIWLMIAGGVTNVPNSEQVALISYPLGRDYFKNVDFTNFDAIYDIKNNIIACVYANDSTVNNEILIYQTETKTLTLRKDWNIDRFATDGETIYGASAIDGKIFKLWDGYEDNDKPIFAFFSQEITWKGKGTYDLYSMEEVFIQAVIAEDDTLDVSFDIYDRNGAFVPNYKTITITGGVDSTPSTGWGSSGLGSSGWGSGEGGGQPIQQIFQRKIVIPEFWRLIIRMTSKGRTPLTINFLTGTFKDRGETVITNNIADNS